MRLITLCLFFLFFPISNASAQLITAEVSLKTQRMNVYIDELLIYNWPVSTAKQGYKTPVGIYTPYWLHKNHRSSIYKNSPMPFSVFFIGNYAIHGTTAITTLGQPASHGCVRLLTKNAEIFYLLIEIFGKQNTRIVIGP